MAKHEISDETRKNFHLFCDNFPFPVMLVHKDRTILAVNKAGEMVGYPTGIRCVDMGKKEHHKGCQANQALNEQTAKRVVGYFDFVGAVLDSYWIPLAGSDELYLHFAADITEWAKKSMIPQKCEAGTDCAGCACG
ncbi:hypothetical protein [Geobacter sp. SVR]|uniref:hypothetical protein n=1 Tax=Geobacter sp. SVR TaxID=2495594 RepID=UPI00143EF499|nr:hypothetical protein [Geobacter sp. SVR]BCS55400.1 hypothetical protein GSVR_37080 [Geobacter sp. SVR]GCF83402.1 hypothetical protein GSbR_00020 [Geobacter sp. SVR]